MEFYLPLIMENSLPLTPQFYQEKEAEKLKRIDAMLKRKKEEEIQKEKSLEYERILAESSQKNGTPWTKKYFTYPCPYCGHYKVRYSNWDDKKMSVAFWGVYSSKVGKHYHCDYCKRDFND